MILPASSPLQARQPVTSGQRRCWIRRTVQRQLRAGKYAYILAVDSDPLSGITELERMKFVMMAMRG
jgi:hypothetical protein